MKTKRLISLIIALVCCLFGTALPTSAAEVISTTVEYLENGDYIETVIICNDTNSRDSTKTGSKTSTYKNSSGETMWSVTVNATFSYTGSSATCTACSRSSASYNDNWTIKSSSASRSGNTATATATATYKTWLTSYDRTETVTLTCSANGTLS